MCRYRRIRRSGAPLGVAVITVFAAPIVGCASSASVPAVAPSVEAAPAPRVVRGVVDLPAGVGPDGVDVVLLEPLLLCVWRSSSSTMYLTEREATRVALGADRRFELTVPRGVTAGRLALAGRGLFTEKILALPEDGESEARLRGLR
jgi:hypothetical protein